MANSLDAAAIANIAKSRSRLLKLADGIRTRKKPGCSKKCLRLDPAYTNIEHLVFGTYRARSSTPDNSPEGFVRRAQLRNSDGSESSRTSSEPNNRCEPSNRCECSRHSPHLPLPPSGSVAAESHRSLESSKEQSDARVHVETIDDMSGERSRLRKPDDPTPRRISWRDVAASNAAKREDSVTRTGSARTADKAFERQNTFPSGIPKPVTERRTRTTSKSSAEETRPNFRKSSSLSEQRGRSPGLQQLRNHTTFRKTTEEDTPDSKASAVTCKIRITPPSVKGSKLPTKNSPKSSPKNGPTAATANSSAKDEKQKNRPEESRARSRSSGHQHGMQSAVQKGERQSDRLSATSKERKIKPPAPRRPDQDSKPIVANGHITPTVEDQESKQTTWAQLRSRSMETPVTVMPKRRNHLTRQYHSLDDTDPPLKLDFNLGPSPSTIRVDTGPIQPVSLPTTLLDSKEPVFRYMDSPRPRMPQLPTADGPLSLPLTCDEEESTIMCETSLPHEDEVQLRSKANRAPGSPSRNFDLRLLAAYQRCEEAAKEVLEAEGWMSDIEERDENSSSGASRAASEEPPDQDRKSPRRIRVKASLGLERLLETPKNVSVISVETSEDSPQKQLPRITTLKETFAECPPDVSNIVVTGVVGSPSIGCQQTGCGSPRLMSTVSPSRSSSPPWSEKTVTIDTGSLTNCHLLVNSDPTGDIPPRPPSEKPCKVPPTLVPGVSLTPVHASCRLLRNRPISRSERHLKTTSTPEIRASEAGSVKDVRRPWSEVYCEVEARNLLAQSSSPNCHSVPNFPRFDVASSSPATTDSGLSFFHRLSSTRATDSMLQKFRKTFSLRFQRSSKGKMDSNASWTPSLPGFGNNDSNRVINTTSSISDVGSSSVSVTNIGPTSVTNIGPTSITNVSTTSADNLSSTTVAKRSSSPRLNESPDFSSGINIVGSTSGGSVHIGATTSSVRSGGSGVNPTLCVVEDTDRNVVSPNHCETSDTAHLTDILAQDSTDCSVVPQSLREESGMFRLHGLNALRSSRERKKGKSKQQKKEARGSKCNSADSGIQVEVLCPSSDGTNEANSAGESPTMVHRRAPSTGQDEHRPISDYLADETLASIHVHQEPNLERERSVVEVFQELDTFNTEEKFFSPVRKTTSVERQLSTPPPIKVRSERIRPKIRRQRARARLRRSISQPLDLEKMGLNNHNHKPIEHGLSDQEASREPSTASSEDEFSSDNEGGGNGVVGGGGYQIGSLPKQTPFRELYEDTVTFAEALWDHVTIDPEELPFKSGEVIEVTDSSDKDWWWGAIGNRSGWFPAAFVRLRVSQEATVEDCILRMSEGSLRVGRCQHQSRKMSVSLLSNEQVRANIVREIVTTERDFVRHLKDVVEGYLSQVRRRPDMFTEEHVSTIFGNVEEIYQFQSTFLKHLESSINWQLPHASEIGHCFLLHKDRFRIYSEYCNNHPLAVSQLQELYADPKYIHFFEACRLLQEMIDISLDGFLLTPVQKICKYPLQLAELLKYTRPDHADYQLVRDALGAMRGVAQLVNERKRRMECLERLIEWQRTIEGWEDGDLLESSSMLIHSGEVTRVTSSWSRDLSLFLFDHTIIYCKKDLLKRNVHVYRGRINLDHCCVFDVEDGKDAQFGITVRNAWKIHCNSRDKWFLFYAKSSLEKSRWLQAFREERQQVTEDRDQGFRITDQAKKAAKLAVLNKSKVKRPRAKIPKGPRPHPDTAVVEILLEGSGPKTRSGSLPSNLNPAVVVNGNARAAPTKKKGSGWFHFGSGKKSKK